MTWAEIERNPGNHDNGGTGWFLPRSEKEAEELGLDDRERYRLRLSEEARVWGIRDGRVFKTLWWDPEHSAYQVGRRHT